MRFKVAPNRLIKTAILVLVILSLGFGLRSLRQDESETTASAAAPAATGPETVATVEGKKIDAKTYRMYLRNGIEALGLSESSEEGRRRVETLKESIIAELIDRTLIEAEAERRNVSIPEEIFSTAYNRRVAELGGQEIYRAYLAEHSLTDQDFRRIVGQEILGELMQKELTAGIGVTAEEARAFYEKERANPNLAALFIDPARARASHILVSARRSQIAGEFRSKGLTKTDAERAAAEEMARRRARAAVILAKARSGQDFAALAREHSEDTGTRDRGGDLGLFTRNTHTAQFDDAVFALKAGQTSDIVETEYGYHIIKLVERRHERRRGYGEVRREIERQILARKRAETLTNWLERRRREAAVQVDPFYRAAQSLTSRR
jgi:peptidyl-prolyl cis-trans isomerase C